MRLPSIVQIRYASQVRRLGLDLRSGALEVPQAFSPSSEGCRTWWRPFSASPNVIQGLGSPQPRNSEGPAMHSHEKSILKFNGRKNYSLDNIPILIMFLVR